MHVTFRKLTISIMVIFFFTGCAQIDKPLRTEEGPVEEVKPANPYYFFAESQIYKGRRD